MCAITKFRIRLSFSTPDDLTYYAIKSQKGKNINSSYKSQTYTKCTDALLSDMKSQNHECKNIPKR